MKNALMIHLNWKVTLKFIFLIILAKTGYFNRSVHTGKHLIKVM